MEGHVVTGPLAFGRSAPHTDAVLDLAGDSDITDPQAEHGGQPQSCANSDQDEGSFPETKRFGESREKTGDFGVG